MGQSVMKRVYGLSARSGHTAFLPRKYTRKHQSLRENNVDLTDPTPLLSERERSPAPRGSILSANEESLLAANGARLHSVESMLNFVKF
jgi:hypothetical protein